MNDQLRPMLKLLATAEDEATREFFAVIKYRDIYGSVRGVHLPLAELKEPKTLEKLLTNAGAYLPENDGRTLKAVRTLKNPSHKVARWVFARTLGWHGGDYRQFVRPKGVIGRQRAGARIRPPRALGAYVKVIGKRGTPKEWSKRVAGPAKYSSRMVLAICAAFAAPLLKMVGMSSLTSIDAPVSLFDSL